MVKKGGIGSGDPPLRSHGALRIGLGSGTRVLYGKEQTHGCNLDLSTREVNAKHNPFVNDVADRPAYTWLSRRGTWDSRKVVVVSEDG